MFGWPSERCSFLPSFLVSKKTRVGLGRRGKRNGMGKNLGLLTQLWLRLRGKEGRKETGALAKNEGGRGGAGEGWVGLLARSRSFALAGNLSAGKNVPKALEHVEPPLALAR